MIKLEKIFNKMKIHFRYIFFSNFNIVVNKLEAFLRFLIPEAASSAESKGSE
jgi:hypothetical protein